MKGRRSWALLGFAGCFHARSTLGLPCEVDTHCDPGQRCELGECAGASDTSGESSGGCEETVVPGPAAHTRVVLLVERSASMSAPTWDDDDDPGTPEVGRFAAVRGALEQELGDAEDRLQLGYLGFPAAGATSSPDESACPVPAGLEVTPAAGSAAEIVAALPPADAPLDGAAATGAAIEKASIAIPPGPADPAALVLVSDGAPTCPPATSGAAATNTLDSAAVTRIEQLAAGGVPTFVIGVGVPIGATPAAVDLEPDMVDAAAMIEQMALAGGRPSPSGPEAFYAADLGVELATLVRQVLFAARSCVVPLPMPIGPGGLSVDLDGQVPPVGDCGSEEGWVAVDGADAISLCGGWCDALRAAGAVELAYHCP